MKRNISTLEDFIARSFKTKEDMNRPIISIEGRQISRLTLSEKQLNMIEWGVVTPTNVWDILCLAVGITTANVDDPSELRFLYQVDVMNMADLNSDKDGINLKAEVVALLRG